MMNVGKGIAMKKRLSTIEEFKNLKVGDNVILTTKKGKILKGKVDDLLTNRGYVDRNEINIFISEIDYPITVNVDKYLSNESSLSDFIVLI